MERNLFEIRCPFQRLSKSDGNLYQCNSLCVKVTQGSAGESRCRKCHLSFDFEVDDQAKMTTGIRVKQVKKEKQKDGNTTD